MSVVEMTRHSACAEADQWVVEVDGNPADGFIVTIQNPLVYLYFSCEGPEELRAASESLSSPTVDGSLKIGSFCKILSVELDCFRGEPDVTYLSVTQSEGQSMAYRLAKKDQVSLARALSCVADSRELLGD